MEHSVLCSQLTDSILRYPAPFLLKYALSLLCFKFLFFQTVDNYLLDERFFSFRCSVGRIDFPGVRHYCLLGFLKRIMDSLGVAILDV